MKAVMIAFDGVLHAAGLGWHDGTCYDVPLPGAIEGLTSLLKDYAVFIRSTREPQQVQEWLTAHAPGIVTEVMGNNTHPRFWNKRGVVGITQMKFPAQENDDAYSFRDWSSTIADSRQFQEYPA